MAVIGLFVSLAALVISVFSVSYTKNNHYKITLTIVIVGVVFINDALRVWQPLPMPFDIKIALVSIFILVVLACIFFANKLSNNKEVT
jgi:phosphatidylserine synthase